MYAIHVMYICMCLLCTCACTVHFDWIEHASSIDILVFCCLINVGKDVFLMSGNVLSVTMCMCIHTMTCTLRVYKQVLCNV